MNLADQVITVEQAQKLVELGVIKQYVDESNDLYDIYPASVFAYVSCDNKSWHRQHTDGEAWNDYPNYSAYPHILPAFTLAEIQELIAVANNGDTVSMQLTLNGVHITLYDDKTPTTKYGSNLAQIACGYLISKLQPNCFIIDRINNHIKGWFVKQK